MMTRSIYPGIEEHKILHFELIDQLSTRESMLIIETSGKGDEFIITFLIKWFFYHTMTIYRLFAWKKIGNNPYSRPFEKIFRANEA